MNNSLTREQLERAWKLGFRASLDDLPDGEIRWERDVWRDLGAPSIATICDELLAERRAADFAIPGGADPGDLDRLLARVNTRAVMRLVEDEAVCLIAATRLVFRAGLREVAP